MKYCRYSSRCRGKRSKGTSSKRIWQKPAFNCENEFGEKKCHACKDYDFCQANQEAKENSIEELFDIAYEKYNEILDMAKKAIEKEESIENLEMLVRVLMDIAIHVNTADITKSSELWEA